MCLQPPRCVQEWKWWPSQGCRTTSGNMCPHRGKPSLLTLQLKSTASSSLPNRVLSSDLMHKKSLRVLLWGFHPPNSLYCAMLSRSVVSDSATSWAVTRQAPLSMGILQARTLEWIATSSSRRSSRLRDWTQVSCIAGSFFTVWATREAHE